MAVKVLYKNLRHSKRPQHENHLYLLLVIFHDSEQKIPVKLFYIVNRINVD